MKFLILSILLAFLSSCKNEDKPSDSQCDSRRTYWRQHTIEEKKECGLYKNNDFCNELANERYNFVKYFDDLKECGHERVLNWCNEFGINSNYSDAEKCRILIDGSNSCDSVELLKKEQGTTEPQITLFFKINKCDGTYPQLYKSNLKIYEKEELSDFHEDARDFTDDPKKFNIYINLLVDLSGSMDANREILADSVGSFIERVVKEEENGNIFLTLGWFDGSPYIHYVGSTTNNKADLLDYAENLKYSSSVDKSTNLNKAVQDSVNHLKNKIINSSASHTIGSVIVMTDGKDKAGYVSHSSLIDYLSNKSDDISIFTLGFDTSPHYDRQKLVEIADQGNSFFAKDIDQMESAFNKLSDKVQGISGSYYILNYCAFSRSGQSNPLRVKINNSNFSATLRTSFDASSFSGSCNFAN